MIPLAERMRPKHSEDFIGQKHLLGPTGVLTKSLSQGKIHSMILWGPPGVGKTSLAYMIAHQLHITFFSLSAINAGVKDIRAILEKAGEMHSFEKQSPILFIDEIHRFSKSQQDALLGAVEKGTVVLIGATTENPSFEVNSALLSRCQVYTLNGLDKEDLISMANKAIGEDELLSRQNIEIEEFEALIYFSGGDARKLYNALELVVDVLSEEQDEIKIKNAEVEKVISQRMARFDKKGEQHYDIISAFIKSIRGSDPNAAVYWLARMIEGGEDERFICRRMVISAAEDVGLANPNALLLANNCMEAVRNIGFPEARIVMSQTAIYLASSPKSNSAYQAIEKALQEVKRSGDKEVPLHLRNAPTKLMKQLNYGKNYQYSHNFENNFVQQDYLPEGLNEENFYQAGKNVQENSLKKRLEDFWRNKYKF